jgi:hypothetical protein
VKTLDLLNPPRIYVEIGQSSLKALDGNDGLELSLERDQHGRLTGVCVDNLISSLRVFLKRHSWRGRVRAYCAIGARGVSLRKLSVPSASKEELERLLLLQIEREFPLPPEELAWGYRNLTDEQPRQNGAPAIKDLLVVAVKRDVIQEYAEILAGCGLIPVFTLGALARSSLCSHPPRAYSLLDIGPNQSELITFENGVPSAIRILPWGASDIEKKSTGPEAESELDRLAQSVDRKWVGQKLYLTGGAGSVEPFTRHFARTMNGGADCQALDIVSGEGRSAAILGLKKLCERDGGAPPMTLQVKTSRDAGRTEGQSVWKWIGLAALLLVVSLALRYAEPFIQKPRLARKLAQNKALREKLPAIDRELLFLQYLQTNQPPYLDLISTMGNAMQGSRIDSLSMNRRGDVAIKASMRDSQQVAQFRSKLIDSGLFSVVVVEEQTPTPDGQKVNVRIVGEWKKPVVGKAPTKTERPATGSQIESQPARIPPQDVTTAPGNVPAAVPLPSSAAAPRPSKE